MSRSLLLTRWLVVAAALSLLVAASSAVAATNADLRANRVAGVAPLSVFFDASQSTTTVSSTDPFHDLHYEFEYGDPGAGDWGDATNDPFLARHSKNEYRGGPLSGHVYETPGVYTAKVTVSDGQGGSSTDQVTITVTDPATAFAGTKTVCYSNDSNFSGCPAGASQVTTNSMSRVEQDAAPGKRLLLKRGDTFNGRLSLPQSGPGILAAFPAAASGGAAPVITSPTITMGNDWRFVDLETSTGNASGTRHFVCNDGIDVRRYVTLLRVHAHGGNRTIGCTQTGGSRNEYFTVVDSILEDTKTSNTFSYVIYHYATFGNVFMGNQIGGAGGGSGEGHNIRFVLANDLVFTFNKFHKRATGANLRLHGAGSDPTDRAILGYNVWGPNAYEALNVNTVSSTFYNPIYDVIIEGNFIPYGQRYINLGMNRGTVRNNVMRIEDRSFGMIRIWQKSNNFPVDNLWIYNNTLYWSSSSNAKMVDLGETNGGTFRGKAHFFDNLIYAPGRSAPSPFPSGDARFTASGNVVITNASSTPFRTASPGVTIDDYETNGGVTAGATSDWFDGFVNIGSGDGNGQNALTAPFLYP